MLSTSTCDGQVTRPWQNLVSETLVMTRWLHAVQFAFKRAVSRLHEMQTTAYLQKRSRS